jgi:cell wall-associated NlpC family hydrolase
MKRKRFIAIGMIAFLTTTGTGVAFGAMIEATESSNNEQVVAQVTKPQPVINSPVTKEVIVSGPVKATSVEAGPILALKTPIVGSVDWMAQEKADKDKREADAKATVKKIQTEAEKKQSELEFEIARLEKIAKDTKTLNETLVLVKRQIGKTPWVFSGSTPSAWDCSGMIRWTYAHLGVDLLHSASAQRSAGKFVSKPKIGDLVSFNYQSYGSAYHIGIYIGPDEMIHAGGKPGDRTEIRSIRDWQKDNGNSQVTYTRIIETNN